MNESKYLTIDWEGPYRFGEFFTNKHVTDSFDEPGVYLWVEVLPNGTDRLSYVGKATGSPSLLMRQQQHYVNMIAGLYTIPREFRNSDRDKEWVPQWRRPEVADVYLGYEKYIRLVEEGFRYAAACQIYLYPTKSDVRILERNLLFDLKPTGTKSGTKTEPQQRLSIRHRNPRWFSDSIAKQIEESHGICLIEK